MSSAMVLGPNCRKQVNFIVLLLRLGLVVFSRVNKVSKVSIRIGVRFSFSDRVGIGHPNME